MYLNRVKVWDMFKEDKNKHVFKIVDLRYGIHDNEPGKVIGDKGFYAYITTRIYE